GRERLAGAGLRACGWGALRAGRVSDVAATRELSLRGLGPPLAAAVVAAGAVAAVWLLLSAPAGIMLAAGMVAGGVLVPWLAFARARRSARRIAGARGGLRASLTHVPARAARLHPSRPCRDAPARPAASARGP